MPEIGGYEAYHDYRRLTRYGSCRKEVKENPRGVKRKKSDLFFIGIQFHKKGGGFMIFKIFAALLAGAAVSFSYGDVTIENFDDAAASQTTLGIACGVAAHTGFWYGYTDTTEKPKAGTTRISPDVCSGSANDRQFISAVVPGGTNATKCLHVAFKNAGTGYPYPFAAVGFHINVTAPGSSYATINLSTMTSVTFMAKGSGNMRLHFVTDKILNYPPGQTWGEMGADFPLSPTWTKVTITTADILPQPGSPQAKDALKWAQCSDKVLQLHFQTAPSFSLGDTVDFWMDDLAMQGVSSSAFGATIPVIFSPVRKQNNQAISVFYKEKALSCSFPSEENVAIALFGLNGGLVKSLYNGAARNVSVPLNVAEGMYLYKIETVKGITTAPLMIKR